MLASGTNSASVLPSTERSATDSTRSVAPTEVAWLVKELITRLKRRCRRGRGLGPRR